jgi:hypothetical protein
MDTVAANEHLGLPADARSYRSAAAILRRMGLFRIRLVTNNPDKAEQLTRAGIHVDQIVPSPAPVTEHNREYLATKRDRMAHRLAGDLVPERSSTVAPTAPTPAASVATSVTPMTASSPMTAGGQA